MRILLVEDHPSLGPDLKHTLEKCYYAVDLTANGEEALYLGLTIPYDLVILDILLPDLGGLEICRQLRAKQCNVPILLLTALDAVDQRIQGLNQGADDYVTKPFDFWELEARVRALLRRDGTPRDPVLRFLDITLDTNTRQVQRQGRHIQLSNKEYALLDFLLRHPGGVLTRTSIAEHVWNEDAEHLSNVIDVYIGYLRAKLCARGEPNVIQAVRGVGYQLKEPE